MKMSFETWCLNFFYKLYYIRENRTSLSHPHIYESIIKVIISKTTITECCFKTKISSCMSHLAATTTVL